MPTYSPLVIDHFRNPRNCGSLADADGIGDAGDPRCGDTLRLYIRVTGDTVTDCTFKACGCGAAIAASSMTTVLLQGKTLTECARLTNSDVVAALGGLPPEKLNCSVLAQTAIRCALRDYYTRRGLSLPREL